MPQMKYFNEIGKIQRWYEDILEKANGRNGDDWLEDFGFTRNDLPQIKLKAEAMEYLVCCQLMLAYEHDLEKPSKELLIECFQNRFDFLNKIYPNGIPNMKKMSNGTHIMYKLKREFEACGYYLFYDDWYEKLPDKILTIEHKYPEVTNETIYQDEQINELDLD